MRSLRPHARVPGQGGREGRINLPGLSPFLFLIQ
jgi:hypothetical protein